MAASKCDIITRYRCTLLQTFALDPCPIWRKTGSENWKSISESGNSGNVKCSTHPLCHVPSCSSKTRQKTCWDHLCKVRSRELEKRLHCSVSLSLQHWPSKVHMYCWKVTRFWIENVSYDHSSIYSTAVKLVLDQGRGLRENSTNIVWTTWHFLI